MLLSSVCAPQSYLQQFGYLQKPLETLEDEFTKEEVAEALR